MKIAHILVPIVMLMSIVMVVSILSCGGGGGSAQLEGTWTLTTTPENDYPAVGDGTYTVTLSWYYEQANIEYYSGSGVIGEEDYKISISRKFQTDQDGNDYYLFLYQEGESLELDSIKCYGILSGTTSASGQYIGRGEGTYAINGTGTFNTIKQ
jgi:hypothetical protein